MSFTDDDNDFASTVDKADQAGQGKLLSEAYPGELDLLRLQSNQLNQLFDVMPAGVVIIDGDGIVVKANDVAFELLGEHLLKRAWIDVIQQAFKPRADDGHEVSLKDGRRVKLDISSFGSQAGQLILITDLTETRLLQDKLSQMQRLSALGRMVSTLAHQVRTPLSAAMLYCSNLGSQNLDNEKRQRFQEKLTSRLQDLEQQVNDMLLYAKSGGKQVVAVLDVADLLDESLAGVEAQVSEASAQLNFDYQVNTPIQIIGNQSALAGAIQNLIHNALQVIDSNAVIDVVVKSSDNVVQISVKDNGKGVNEEDAEKIFEPFYTSKVQGTGLGLAVVKSVAKAHHGDVTLTSTLGEGAEFCISIPLFMTNKD
ncbi:HAMP domain-containing sensor histidine kinase [Thalassotalea sp. Y01]|uniref:sensor histidine kinase n=1 Tax=Thalassotalea sp. Y01 TaxID=2729613 RepID=UPI00145E7412|nr:HAMP domain-containing sensor histidine kinase [Thalassotalea sp. Y01]NMP14819.1 HAMP domain-containing histidine kinase [Thalassotalea sp. Y01]